MNRYKFSVVNSDECVEGFGSTLDEGKQDAIASLEMGYPPECSLGEMIGVEPIQAIKTDFGPNGPQPGTLAYTAFLMAQLCPTNEADGIYDGFWDDWKLQLYQD